MIHDFATIWSQRADVIAGLLNTAILLVTSGIAALVAGVCVAPLLLSRRRALARFATAYVDAMRCAPFLLFVYLIYFGLPALGLRLSNWTAGALALIVYHGAYMAELLRGAWQQVPAAIIEAGNAFGFRGFALLRRIVLPPVFLRAFPMIASQLIQIVKDSAFLTVIAVNELTHEITGIQSTYFIPFAAFITAVLLYWCLCLVLEVGASVLNKFAEERRA